MHILHHGHAEILTVVRTQSKSEKSGIQFPIFPISETPECEYQIKVGSLEGKDTFR